MSSVAWKVPDELAGLNLWQVLSAAVRRQADEDEEGRLVVDDSKAVHGSSGGLKALEGHTVPAVAPWLLKGPAALADYVERLCRPSREGLAGECWYTGRTALPLEKRDDLEARQARLAQACA